MTDARMASRIFPFRDFIGVKVLSREGTGANAIFPAYKRSQTSKYVSPLPDPPGDQLPLP